MDPLIRLEDPQQIDDLVYNYLKDTNLRGERFTMFHIQSLGYNITRQQLRESIYRIDSEGRFARRPGARTPRGVYNVLGSGHLYHTDGKNV